MSALSRPRAFATTMNGRTSVELVHRAGRPPVSNEIARLLDRLDGERRFAFCLWELPAGTAFDDVDVKRWPLRYLQAAGTRDRMTVELRRGEEPGNRHFVVGKCPTREPAPSEAVRWDAYETEVFRVEVFTAAEAMPVFLSYLLTNDVPDEYTLRAIAL